LSHVVVRFKAALAVTSFVTRGNVQLRSLHLGCLTDGRLGRGNFAFCKRRLCLAGTTASIDVFCMRLSARGTGTEATAKGIMGQCHETAAWAEDLVNKL
jgi:hypothetical protein